MENRFGFEDCREFLEMEPEEQTALLADYARLLDEQEEDLAQEQNYAEHCRLMQEAE